MSRRLYPFLYIILSALSVQAQIRVFVQGGAGVSTLGGYDATYLYNDPQKPGFFSVRYLPNTTYSLGAGLEKQEKRSPHIFKSGLSFNAISTRMAYKVLDTFKNFMYRSPVLRDNEEIAPFISARIHGSYCYNVVDKFYVGGGLSYDLILTKFWLGELGEAYWDRKRYTSLYLKSLFNVHAIALYKLKHSEFSLNCSVSANPLFKPYHFGPKHIKTIQINYGYTF